MSQLFTSDVNNENSFDLFDFLKPTNKEKPKEKYWAKYPNQHTRLTNLKQTTTHQGMLGPVQKNHNCDLNDVANVYAQDWFDILNGKKWQIVCLGGPSGFFALNDSIFMYKLGLYLTCYPSANTYLSLSPC